MRHNEKRLTIAQKYAKISFSRLRHCYRIIWQMLFIFLYLDEAIPRVAPLIRASCINICRLSVFNERTSSFNSRFSISCFFKVTSKTCSLDSRSAGLDIEAETMDKRRNRLFILSALNVWSQQCYLFAMPTFSSKI